MTEQDLMFKEMVQAQNSLSLTAAMTKEKIDAKMRATVKELLNYRYASKGNPIKKYNGKNVFTDHFEDSVILGELLFGPDPSGRRQVQVMNIELNRTRPLRIHNYVQRLADIFPPEHLTHLLRTSLRMTPEALISFYEANPNEAKLSDYAGQPSAIDPNVFKNHD